MLPSPGGLRGLPEAAQVDGAMSANKAIAKGKGRPGREKGRARGIPTILLLRPSPRNSMMWSGAGKQEEEGLCLVS